jgi:protein TonB
MKKKLVFSMTLLLLTTLVEAQIATPSTPSQKIEVDDKIWLKVEQEAEFPGGNDGWRNFLVNNLRIDSIADFINVPDSLKSISHSVILKFIVSKDGSLKEIGIEKSTNPYCAMEAVRVMKLSPKWIPAYQNRRTVNAYRRQPFTFYFQNE